MTEERIPKIISLLEVFGLIAFILLTTIGLGFYIPHLNDELSILEQNISDTNDELEKIYRIEIGQLAIHSNLNVITGLYPIIYQGADLSDMSQTLTAFEMLNNHTLHQYQLLIFLGSEYQGNRISFENLNELDSEQLHQMLDELNILNGQRKIKILCSLTEVENEKIEIEKKRDNALNIILILQTITFIMTNSGELFKHYKTLRIK